MTKHTPLVVIDEFQPPYLARCNGCEWEGYRDRSWAHAQEQAQWHVREAQQSLPQVDYSVSIAGAHPFTFDATISGDDPLERLGELATMIRARIPRTRVMMYPDNRVQVVDDSAPHEVRANGRWWVQA